MTSEGSWELQSSDRNRSNFDGNPANTSTLISVSNQLQRRGVKYVYGGKIGASGALDRPLG
jgi:hypothetical protein